MISQKTKEEFEENIQRTQGCYFWTGKTQHGRTYLWVDDHQISVRRISYELHNPNDPPLDDTMLVKNSCEQKLCVRGDHLYLEMRGRK